MMPRAARAQVSATKILERVRIDPKRSIDFHAAAFPESVFVGQQVTYQVAVFLSDEARSRLRRNPEFLPPELRGLLAYELGSPTRIAPQSVGGTPYEVHIFQRALFPVAPGAIDVPAPQLTYALPQSSSYFSREEKFSLDGESVQVRAIPIPTEGRPVEFTGAVGVFNVSMRLDTATARVGDPLVLTLQVQGIGNVKLLPRPPLEIEWATAVPGTERVRVDTAGSLVRGTKEFDWILTPSRAGRVSVPILRYGYFNPYRAKFVNADAPAIEIDVRAGNLVRAEDADGSALLPLHTDGSTSRGSSLHLLTDVGTSGASVVIVICLLAPIPAVVLALKRRRQSRGTRQSRVKVEAAGLALWSGAPGAATHDARSVRRTLHRAVADRLQLATNELVTQHQIIRALRRRGVTRETTERVVSLLDLLDAHAFAATTAASQAAADGAELASHIAWSRQAADLFAKVNAEAVRGGGPLPPDRWVMRSATMLLAVGALGAFATTGVSTVAHAAPTRSSSVAPDSMHARDSGTVQVPTVVTEVRAHAASAYARHAFAEASGLFAGLVRGAPRDPSLLEDWGTAAWAAGDTVHAVIAWQRAARLEPLDAELQERLSLLPSGARGGLADVPLVSVPLLALFSVASWLFGWGLLAMHLRRSIDAHVSSSRWKKHVGVGMLLVAAAASGAGWWGYSTLDASDLAVIVRPETLHVAPGADADAMGGVATGDIVRTFELREGWRRVRHADGREGWLPQNRLVALLDDAPSR